MPGLPKPDKATVLGVTQKRDDDEAAAKESSAARAAQKAADTAAELQQDVCQGKENDAAAPKMAPAAPKIIEPTKPSQAPKFSLLSGVFSDELSTWQNPADTWKSGGWSNPVLDGDDESAIDDELAAAEAKVAELRRLKQARSDNVPAATTGSFGVGTQDGMEASPRRPVSSRLNKSEPGGGGSLWGSYNEAAENSSFQDALSEWRTGGTASFKNTNGGELWGAYDEREQEHSFREAVAEWRGEGDKAQPTDVGAHSVATAVQQDGMAAREKKSCWQCYKLHFADASLFIDDCKDKPFCNEKCLDNFKRKQAEKEAKKNSEGSCSECLREEASQCFQLCNGP